MHEGEFPEETKEKLKIIGEYFQSAIYPFLRSASFTKLVVADLFAGPGSDATGNKGTPMLFLKALAARTEDIRTTGTVVKVILNDIDTTKSERLTELKQSWDKHNLPFTIEVHNKPAEELFPSILSELRATGTGSIFCLDQFGVNFVDRSRFLELVRTPRCDVLFFLPTSYVHRFAELFAPIFGVDPKVAKEVEAARMHDLICDTFSNMIPSNTEAYVAGYSIHKGPNHYGLVFLTHKLLGLKKFVDVCWANDPNNGDSNTGKNLETAEDNGAALFADGDTMTDKERRFAEDLRVLVTSCAHLTEKDIVAFTYRRGMQPRHALPTLRQLKREGLIDRVPRFTLKLVLGSSVVIH